MNHNASPHITVIIPCYNHGTFLPETLASVMSQDYRPFDVIIINDGSTDETTLKVLGQLATQERITVLNIENGGPSIARNQALKNAKGEYLALIDADDRMLPGFLSSSVRSILKLPEAAVVYGNYRHFGEKNNLMVQQAFDITRQLMYNQIALCVLMRKQALIDACGFDEYLSKLGLEDWDLWLTLYEKGWKFIHVNEILFEIRVNYASRTYEVANRNIDHLKSYIYNKHAMLLSQNYFNLYHEIKNIKKSFDFRIGNSILKIPRIIKRWICGKK
ncbi:MAG: glycosyltransferase family A protein [Bacteroidota bacterium]